MLDLERFSKLFPRAKDKDEILHAILRHAPAYEIDTPTRLAMFLAQIGHESFGLTRWEESFRYSPERLLVIFPRYFEDEEDAAAVIARGAQAVADRVYGGRMGNGPEGSGDGYRYRGRGPIQLTGHDNYERFGPRTGLDLLGFPDVVSHYDQGMQVACAFFEDAHCLEFADAKDIVRCTRRINGGLTGLPDRKLRYEHARTILGVP